MSLKFPLNLILIFIFAVILQLEAYTTLFQMHYYALVTRPMAKKGLSLLISFLMEDQKELEELRKYPIHSLLNFL